MGLHMLKIMEILVLFNKDYLKILHWLVG